MNDGQADAVAKPARGRCGRNRRLLIILLSGLLLVDWTAGAGAVIALRYARMLFACHPFCFLRLEQAFHTLYVLFFSHLCFDPK